MNVTYACPVCETASRENLDSQTCELPCSHCGAKVEIRGDAVEGDRVTRCLVCPSTDLYMRKDFPQRVGVALVTVGVVGSFIAWYHYDLLWTFGILFATALADVVLYALVGDSLMCYRCHAEYRGCAEMDAHGHFDLETHEKYRQLAARLQGSQPPH